MISSGMGPELLTGVQLRLSLMLLPRPKESFMASKGSVMRVAFNIGPTTSASPLASGIFLIKALK